MSLHPSTPILIVEDYKTMLRIMRNLLKQIGFEDVDAASDGSAALEHMAQRDYGLVITDWNMAPMTGFELLKRTRQGTRNADVPFIMVTAEAGTQHILAARAAGVNGYLIKPFNAQTLKDKIEETFGRMAA
jgi:two-component system chemotaxis response regulator CheY